MTFKCFLSAQESPSFTPVHPKALQVGLNYCSAFIIVVNLGNQPWNIGHQIEGNDFQSAFAAWKPPCFSVWGMQKTCPVIWWMISYFGLLSSLWIPLKSIQTNFTSYEKYQSIYQINAQFINTEKQKQNILSSTKQLLENHIMKNYGGQCCGVAGKGAACSAEIPYERWF